MNYIQACRVSLIIHRTLQLQNNMGLGLRSLLVHDNELYQFREVFTKLPTELVPSTLELCLVAVEGRAEDPPPSHTLLGVEVGGDMSYYDTKIYYLYHYIV